MATGAVEEDLGLTLLKLAALLSLVVFITSGCGETEGAREFDLSIDLQSAKNFTLDDINSPIIDWEESRNRANEYLFNLFTPQWPVVLSLSEIRSLSLGMAEELEDERQLELRNGVVVELHFSRLLRESFGFLTEAIVSIAFLEGSPSVVLVLRFDDDFMDNQNDDVDMALLNFVYSSFVGLSKENIVINRSNDFAVFTFTAEE